MRILFWNTKNNKNINSYVVNLVQDYNIDVLVMAEYNADKENLSTLFEEYHQNLVSCNTSGCERISIWSNYVEVDSGFQDKYYSIQIFCNKYILCCVHLMSDLHGDHRNERLAKIQQIMYEIQKTEEDIKSRNTIIIGDFNEMPYDNGCLSANGFHGLPVLSTEDRAVRVVNGIEYRKFYNPMWNLLGNFAYPPGTYYLNKSALYSPMWYMLDQIILSKDILPYFREESLKIITSCSAMDLTDKYQHPNKKISDHFPIMCEINL